MAEDKLREAERALNADPADKSKWAAYRTSYVQGGNSPSDWLDEIVRRTASGIKNILAKGLEDVKDFPRVFYFVINEDYQILHEYKGHGKRDFGCELRDAQWGPPQNEDQNRSLLLTKKGLFYFAYKELVAHFETDEGRIMPFKDAGRIPGPLLIPNDFIEYDLSYILNSESFIRQLEFRLNIHGGRQSWASPLLEALKKQNEFGAELITDELTYQVKIKKPSLIEVGKKYPALENFEGYDGHIEPTPGFKLEKPSSNPMLVTTEGIFMYSREFWFDKEMRDGQICNLESSDRMLVPAAFDTYKLPKKRLYLDCKQILEQIINYEDPKANKN